MRHRSALRAAGEQPGQDEGSGRRGGVRRLDVWGARAPSKPLVGADSTVIVKSGQDPPHLNLQLGGNVHRQRYSFRVVAAIAGSLIAYPALAQLQLSNVRCPDRVVLANRSPAPVGVRVDYLAAGPQQLQVWVEEYPSGSGCGGNMHHTNGGKSVSVNGGSGWVDIGVPWFGNSRGESYPGGFLKVGARLGGFTASAATCCRFGFEAR